MIMFTTLDGIAEFPVYPSEPGDAEELPDDPMWDPRMDSIDTLLLGRVSYLAWSRFWPAQKNDPKSSDWAKRFSRFADRAEKVVFSKSLKSAEWPNSRIVAGDIRAEVERLKKLPGKDMALGGGPRIAQSFLAERLVDEMLIEVFPSLVGSGKPFFRVQADPNHAEDVVPLGAVGRQDFKLLESRSLKDGTLFLHYQRSN